MKLGVMVQLDSADIDKKIGQVRDYGFDFFQLCGWKKEFFTDEIAQAIKESCKKYEVQVSTFWCGWTGPQTWNFYDGPLTLGLVPTEYRYARMKDLMEGSDFAKKLGVVNVATHVGFLPENPTSSEFYSVVSAIKTVAQHCKDNGQYFLFETGQETPVTLRRTIETVGIDNLGINLDPANLIMYGKANPVDALDVFGEFVREVHAKDGCYPTNGKELGKEVPIGQGKVNFPLFIKKLKEVGYDGSLIIEREIFGDEQIEDIKNSKIILEELI